MPPSPMLTYRDDFTSPPDRAAVYGLLRDTFGLDVSPLGEFDLWDRTYRAFAYLDDTGLCVANAATFGLEFVIDGRRVNAMGIQSVATRPAWRGRGLSRELLDHALRWCDGQSPLTFLMTAIPRFYEPMGFRTLAQPVFRGGPPGNLAEPGPCRRLDLGERADRELVARVLRRRSPVSTRFAVTGLPGAFFLNLLNEPQLAAWHVAAHDAVVVTAERGDGTFCLVDVAAPRMPRLAEIVAALQIRPHRVEVQFPPDRLDWGGAPVPAEGATVLMLRGPHTVIPAPALPETAAF